MDLNPDQPDPAPGALVIPTGVAWERLRRLFSALELGQVEIRYATGGGQTGIQWSADGSKAQLILPPPKLETGNVDLTKLSIESMQVCLPGDIPATRNVLISG